MPTATVGALEPEGLGEAVDDPVGQAVRVVGLDQAGQDDRELVAAQPADGVAGADGGPEPRGHLAEQLVTGRVAERVVDLLEPVQVAEQHAEVRSVRPTAARAAFEPVEEQRPVGQAR